MKTIEDVKAEYKDKFCRSVETGWVGYVVDVEDHGEPMLKMKGYNRLTHTVGGGNIMDHLDDDDVQWFAPADVTIQTVK